MRDTEEDVAFFTLRSRDWIGYGAYCKCLPKMTRLPSNLKSPRKMHAEATLLLPPTLLHPEVQEAPGPRAPRERGPEAEDGLRVQLAEPRREDVVERPRVHGLGHAGVVQPLAALDHAVHAGHELLVALPSVEECCETLGVFWIPFPPKFGFPPGRF